ncbi:cytosol aminopeptidase family, catalytic domain-containing protein, partial [Coemansia spiralis]
AVVGLGQDGEISDGMDYTREIVRTAVANGVRQLCSRGPITDVAVGPMPCQQASAEGATLALYKFDAFKSKLGSAGENAEKAKVAFTCLEQAQPASDSWDAGIVYGEAQNFARDLMNAPANHMTPTIFANRVKDEFATLDNVQVNVYDQAWAERQRMGGLLAVSKGSEEPLRFVEIIYRGRGGGDVPLAMVGKGITFDTGGYNLKPGRHMDLMKGDMGGGATVVAAMRAIARLRLPIDVVATVPLCENMVSGGATKVSDVYTSRAGLTVEVMNTDAEGRIVLADALHYTIETHQPRAIVDVATLTGAMVAALGELYTGVFTPSPRLWAALAQASRDTDEPVWRMPLHDAWDAMLKSPVADLSNIGNKAEAGACTAAAFLRQFVGTPRALPGGSVLRDQNTDEALPRWAHLDIAGPMEASASSGYHQKGMSGRPTRLLIELARILAQA